MVYLLILDVEAQRKFRRLAFCDHLAYRRPEDCQELHDFLELGRFDAFHGHPDYRDYHRVSLSYRDYW